MKTHNYIYKITNKINGKQYIGMHRTDDIDDGYMGSGVLIKQAIRKYGKKSFIKEILEYCDDLILLNEQETHYILLYNTMTPNGYNLTTGGENGFDISEETREKISISNIKRFENEEEREKSRQRRLELCRTDPSFLQKLSEAQNKYIDAHPEVRQRSSQTMKRLQEDTTFKKNRKEKMQILLNDPQYIENLRQKAIQQFSDPQARERHSIITKEKMGNKKVREKISKSTKEAYAKLLSDPHQYKVISERNAKAGQKTYKVIFRNGTHEIVTNLKQWCREKNICYNSLLKVANGHQKQCHGMVIEKLEINNPIDDNQII